jgi:hypothetical protein
MTATAHWIGRTHRALIVSLCLLAMMAVLLNSGVASPVAAHSAPVVAGQQIASSGVPSVTQRPCLRTGLSQSSGTCAFGSFVALDRIASGDLTLQPTKSSRFAITADAAPAKIRAGRLERPPRF